MVGFTSVDSPPVLDAFGRLPHVSIVPIRLRFDVTVKNGPPNVMDMSCKVDQIGVTNPKLGTSAS